MSDCEFERVTLLEEGENSEEEGTSTPKPSLTHKPQLYFGRLPSYHLNHVDLEEQSDSEEVCLPRYEEVSVQCMAQGNCSCHDFGGDCCSACIQMEDNVATIRTIPVNVDLFHFNSFWTLVSFFFGMAALALVQMSLTWPYWLTNTTTGISYGLYRDTSHLHRNNYQLVHHDVQATKQNDVFENERYGFESPKRKDRRNVNVNINTFKKKGQMKFDNDEYIIEPYIPFRVHDFFDDEEDEMEREVDLLEVGYKRDVENQERLQKIQERRFEVDEERQQKVQREERKKHQKELRLRLDKEFESESNEQSLNDDYATAPNVSTAMACVVVLGVASLFIMFLTTLGSLLLYTIRDHPQTAIPDIWCMYSLSHATTSFSRYIKVHRLATSFALSALGFAAGTMLLSSSAQFLLHDIPEGYERGCCVYLNVLASVCSYIYSMTIFLSTIQVTFTVKYPVLR